MTIPCPICKKPVGMTDPEMPFCSERCRLLDLGNWAAERYVISTPVRPDQLSNRHETQQSGLEEDGEDE